MPALTIGGVPATVQFSGLIYPGEWQLNVVVPTGDRRPAAYHHRVWRGRPGDDNVFGNRASIGRKFQNEANLRLTMGAHRVYVS